MAPNGTNDAEPKSERFNMFVSKSELDAIDEWAWKHRIRSKSEAVRRLCQIGMTVGPMVTEAAAEVEGAAFSVTALSDAIGPEGFDPSKITASEFNDALLEAEKSLNRAMAETYLRMTTMRLVVDALASGESFEVAVAKAKRIATEGGDIRARAARVYEAMTNLPETEGGDA